MRTRGEFKKEYCERSGITTRFFDKRLVVMHCSCDADNCDGWSVISNDRESIKRHKDLYGVKD
jgi:hypothetical protein